MKIKLLMISVIVLLLLSISAPVLAQSPTPVVSSGSSGEETVVEGFGSPDVLWSQPSLGGNSVASQYLPDYPGGFYSADDFSNTDPWNIESIFVEGVTTGIAYLTNADSLHWFIYPDAAGIPAGDPESGGHLWSHICLPGDPEVSISGASNTDVTLDIVQAKGEPLNLPPGTYWLCFYPTIDFGSYGQWFWDIASTTNLSVAQLIDPDNLLGGGYTSWTPWTTATGDGTAHDAAFSLDGYVGTPLPPNTRYLHCTDGLFDLDDPLNTQWLQLLPMFGLKYHLSSWDDNGDGSLSPSDLIEMYRKPDGPVRPYHVDEVTITLCVTPEKDNGEDRMYIELVGGYNASALENPIDTRWHEVYPTYCTAYNITDWEDNGSHELDYCDLILLQNEYNEERTSWHVEEVAVDIVVTPEPWPVGGEAYPVGSSSNIVIWTIIAACLTTCIVLLWRKRPIDDN